MNFREDLDGLCTKGCATPGCPECTETIYLHSKCHVGAPLTAQYTKNKGVVKLCCHVCGKIVCNIAVASEDDGQWREEEYDE